MIITLSPSKGQDVETPTPSNIYTFPAQLEDSQVLINEARKFDTKAIFALMDVSENIAILTLQHFKQWHIPFTADNAKAALFAFKGDAYAAIEKKNTMRTIWPMPRVTCVFYPGFMAYCVQWI